MRESDIVMSFSQLGVVGTWGWLRVPVYIHHHCMEYFCDFAASQPIVFDFVKGQ